jgi:hypothetical protein
MPIFKNFRATKLSNAFILNSLVVSLNATLSVLTYNLIDKYNEHIPTYANIIITFLVTLTTTLLTYLLFYYLFDYGGGLLASKKHVTLSLF